MTIIKNCNQCNKEFKIKPYRETTAHFCSKICAYSNKDKNELTSKKLKGRILNPKNVFKKGHIHSEEVRAKLRGKRPWVIPWNKKPDAFIDCLQCKKNVKIKPAFIEKQKFCSRICRDKNNNHGKTSDALRIRMSKKYRLWRTAIFKRDDYTCQFCFIRGGRLNADHIKPFSQYPKLRFELTNGRTLCLDCHRATETFGSKCRKNNYSATSKWNCVAVS